MNVLHVCTTAATARLLLLDKLRALRSDGHRIAVACSPGPEVDAVRHAGFEVHPVAIPRGIRPWADALALLRLLRLMLDLRPDAVHTHNSKAGLLGRLAARFAGVPEVMHTYHGLSFGRHDPPLRKALFAFLEHLGGRLTDHAFSQGREDLDWVVSHGVMPAERIRWIGNGIDVQTILARAARALPAELALEGTVAEPLVLFAGRLEPVKGPEVLLEAWTAIRASVPGARLAFAGEGPLRLELERRARAHGTSVRFLGFRDDLPALLAAADLVVLPSRKEGVPRVLMEAMLLGRACIGSDIPGNRELFGRLPAEAGAPRRGILVPVGDPDALARAAVSCLQDIGGREALGRRAAEAVRAELREDLVAARLLEGYRAVADRLLPSTAGSLSGAGA